MFSHDLLLRLLFLLLLLNRRRLFGGDIGDEFQVCHVLRRQRPVVLVNGEDKEAPEQNKVESKRAE